MNKESEFPIDIWIHHPLEYKEGNWMEFLAYDLESLNCLDLRNNTVQKRKAIDELYNHQNVQKIDRLRQYIGGIYKIKLDAFKPIHRKGNGRLPKSIKNELKSKGKIVSKKKEYAREDWEMELNSKNTGNHTKKKKSSKSRTDKAIYFDSVEQFHKETGVSKTIIHRWIKSGKLIINKM